MFNIYSSILFALLAINAQHVNSIIGGYYSKIEDVSYMVSIRMQGEHKCGGAIIGKCWVLTAAHCILAGQTVYEHDVAVRSGSSKRSSGGKLHRAVQLIRHPNYTEATNDYDIGVIKVEPPFAYDSRTQPIDIPSSDEAENTTWISACGWGCDKPDTLEPELSEGLKCASIPKIGRRECAEDLEGILQLFDHQVCYGYRDGREDTCQGDSGGVGIDKETGKVLCVTSVGGDPGSRNSPGIYTDVPKLKPWIMSQIGSC